MDFILHKRPLHLAVVEVVAEVVVGAAGVCRAWAAVSVSVCLEVPTQEAMLKEALLFLATCLLTSVFLLLFKETKFSSLKHDLGHITNGVPTHIGLAHDSKNL